VKEFELASLAVMRG